MVLKCGFRQGTNTFQRLDILVFNRLLFWWADWLVTLWVWQMFLTCNYGIFEQYLTDTVYFSWISPAGDDSNILTAGPHVKLRSLHLFFSLAVR